VKTATIPKTHVEPSRRELYDRALARVKKREPGYKLSDMLRESMDRFSAKQLGISYAELKAKV